ncbi:hypothetical protein ACJZ2D_013370 [Fusarium nematophilum]
MKLYILSLLVLASDTILSQAASNPSGPNNLTVRTSTGTFMGLIDPQLPNTRQWRAIPFAEPPVGSRRWLPPQKLSSLPSVHHYATKLPPSCPQFVTTIESMWNLPLTKGNFIYNGAQNDSSGLIPTPWVERPQSAIIVTINYRVNIFGFPNGGLADGEQNLSILDQRAALEWVHDNIAAFGHASRSGLSEPMGTSTFIGRRQRNLNSTATVSIDLTATTDYHCIKAGLGVYKDHMQHMSLVYDFDASIVICHARNTATGLDRTSKSTLQVKKSAETLSLKVVATPAKYRLFARETSSKVEEGEEWREPDSCETQELAAWEMTGPVFGAFAHPTTAEAETVGVVFLDLAVQTL